METCEYCNGEIDLHLVTLVSAGGHEWRGTCARCGYVVSHLVDHPLAPPLRRAS